MILLESLENRASLILSGAVSFIVVIGATRLAGEPLVQLQAMKSSGLLAQSGNV